MCPRQRCPACPARPVQHVAKDRFEPFVRAADDEVHAKAAAAHQAAQEVRPERFLLARPHGKAQPLAHARLAHAHRDHDRWANDAVVLPHLPVARRATGRASSPAADAPGRQRHPPTAPGRCARRRSCPRRPGPAPAPARPPDASRPPARRPAGSGLPGRVPPTGAAPRGSGTSCRSTAWGCAAGSPPASPTAAPGSRCATSHAWRCARSARRPPSHALPAPAGPCSARDRLPQDVWLQAQP
jgi:hypothetical protein